MVWSCRRRTFPVGVRSSTPADVNPDELAKALRELDTVETAYVMRPGPPPVNPAMIRATRTRVISARHPTGSMRPMPGDSGGDGAGIGFVDMEQGWNLNHEDLARRGSLYFGD